MKSLFDAVLLNMAKLIDLYRLGGVIGLLLGVTASILISQTRRWETGEWFRVPRGNSRSSVVH